MTKFKIFYGLMANVEEEMNKWAESLPSGCHLLGMEVVPGENDCLTIVLAYLSAGGKHGAQGRF